MSLSKLIEHFYNHALCDDNRLLQPVCQNLIEAEPLKDTYCTTTIVTFSTGPTVPSRDLWLHTAATTRQLAEDILERAATGAFLIRAGLGAKDLSDEYSLSFRVSASVQHFKIFKSKDGVFECGNQLLTVWKTLLAII